MHFPGTKLNEQRMTQEKLPHCIRHGGHRHPDEKWSKGLATTFGCCWLAASVEEIVHEWLLLNWQCSWLIPRSTSSDAAIHMVHFVHVLHSLVVVGQPPRSLALFDTLTHTKFQTLPSFVLTLQLIQNQLLIFLPLVGKLLAVYRGPCICPFCIFVCPAV